MKKKILILAANPKNTSRLRLDEEVREIDDALQRSRYRDEFELRQKWAVSSQDIRRIMLDFQPNIVHFCGHGEGEAGIVFEDKAGDAHLVSAEALAGFFQQFKEDVESVILNACYSEIQAKAIARHIPYVIGMSKEIGDETAIEFAVAFYDALGAGKSTEYAYNLGQNAIHQIKGKTEHLIPILITKKAPQTQQDYDIFISYHRENKEWILSNLYYPLLQCRTFNNRRPRIFFDASEYNDEKIPNAIEVSRKFQALQQSHHIIPVYTESYFQDKGTRSELNSIAHLENKDKLIGIHPILVDASAEEWLSILVINNITYLNIKSLNWFVELIKNVGLILKIESKPTTLEFLTQPIEVIVNHTLPVIEVAFQNEDGIVDCEDEITISSEQGELQGTKTIRTQNGKASFVDLSFGTSIESTRLIIQSEGYKKNYSHWFSVKPPISSHPFVTTIMKESPPIIKPHVEEIFFFDSGKALAIFEAAQISVYDLKGNCLCEVPFLRRIRLVRRQASFLAIADWTGNVLIIADNGKYYQYALGSIDCGFSIPGDIAFEHNIIFIGFWNGIIYRIPLGETPLNEFKHEAGVQSLLVSHDQIYICDLEGKLCIIQHGKQLKSHTLESSILLLKQHQDRIIAVGEQKLYYFALQYLEVIDEVPPLTKVLSVLDNADHFLILDAHGKGLCYDKEFVIRAQFHTQPGAVPISSDKKGKYSVFRYPDGTRALMVNERIVYTHISGPLAISPQGDCFAISEQNEIKIFDIYVLPQFYEGKIK